MVGASKILTVSYGTFSCTLEGFEEPFSTMKAIAEYFRDLAADDRYFGAEPPTPDAEMLHRIAEREIQRRVEAKISEHGVVLRADAAPAAEPAVIAPTALMPAATPTAEAAPAAMPVVETAPEAADTGAGVFAEYFEDEDEAPTQAAGRDESEGDSVAAKLSRIRAVVAAAQAAPAVSVEDEETAADFAPTASVPVGDFGFELDLDDVPARLADEADEADEVGEAAPVVEAVAEADLEAEADEAFDDETEEAFLEEAAEAATDAPQMIAETGAPDEFPDEADVETDVEPVAVATGAADDIRLASIGTRLEEATDEVAVEEEIAAEEVIEDETWIDAEIEAAAEVMVDEEPVEEEPVETSALDLGAWRMDAAADEAAASDEAEEDDLDLAAELEPELEAEDEDDFDAEFDDAAELEDDFEDAGELEGAFEDEAEIEAEAADDVEADEVEAEEEDAPEAATGKTGFFGRAAARVIKIRKTRAAVQDDETDEVADIAAEPEHAAAEDRSAAIFAALNDESDEDEEFDAEIDEETAGESDAALLAGIGAAIGETGLDADAEDDLLRELADVAREARRDSHEGRAILEGNADDDDASVERLMEEAKSKLEGDESRRRFSAISHLKAAVVATVADRKMKLRDAPVSGEAEADEEIERYRDDLSKAVRPRRPAADSAPTTRRPTIETRQAPLVLVSEQRIDAPTSPRNDNAVVRPRRISAGNLVRNEETVQDDIPETALSPDEAKSFAEFAERLGAVNLSDMLEAAAAYTATVEGLPHFSRPQILSKVARVAEDEEYSREDGLRSFGMLLRQGKIQKISRGQFMITEASKFMSEARRAAR